MKIYLALPISGRSYEDVVAELFRKKDQLEGIGYEVLQPMTAKGYLRNEKKFVAHGYDNPVSTNHAIVERDKWMVQQCDVVLMDLSAAVGGVDWVCDGAGVGGAAGEAYGGGDGEG